MMEWWWRKWCCTGLLGEIGEICWYMYIHIHTTERFEFWWFIILMISSMLLSPLGFGGSISVVPFEKRLSRQWSTSWSSNMHPKIKRPATIVGNCHWPTMWEMGYFLFIFDERLSLTSFFLNVAMYVDESPKWCRKIWSLEDWNMMKYDGTTCYPKKLSHRKKGEQFLQCTEVSKKSLKTLLT